jgi:hypothetical protein
VLPPPLINSPLPSHDFAADAVVTVVVAVVVAVLVVNEAVPA